MDRLLIITLIEIFGKTKYYGGGQNLSSKCNKVEKCIINE